jgi:hypothetical protein
MCTEMESKLTRPSGQGGNSSFKLTGRYVVRTLVSVLNDMGLPGICPVCGHQIVPKNPVYDDWKNVDWTKTDRFECGCDYVQKALRGEVG